MIQPLDGKQVDDAAMHAGLRIARSVHQAGKTCLQNGTGTHRTGFERDEQFAPGQSIVAQIARRVTQGRDLCMRRRIVVADRRIEAAPNDAPRLHDDRADRHLAQALGSQSERDRLTHEEFVVH
jgi:hypothetical protein